MRTASIFLVAVVVSLAPPRARAEDGDDAAQPAPEQPHSKGFRKLQGRASSLKPAQFSQGVDLFSSGATQAFAPAAEKAADARRDAATAKAKAKRVDARSRAGRAGGRAVQGRGRASAVTVGEAGSYEFVDPASAPSVDPARGEAGAGAASQAYAPAVGRGAAGSIGSSSGGSGPAAGVSRGALIAPPASAAGSVALVPGQMPPGAPANVAPNAFNSSNQPGAASPNQPPPPPAPGGRTTPPSNGKDASVSPSDPSAKNPTCPPGMHSDGGSCVPDGVYSGNYSTGYPTPDRAAAQTFQQNAARFNQQNLGQQPIGVQQFNGIQQNAH